jgi:hypothetical protein
MGTASLNRGIAAAMLADLDALTDAHVAHLEDAWDGYPRLEEAARADLRRGIGANLEELSSLLRSGVPSSALITPVGALAYARRMRAEGVRLRALEQAYHHSLAMTRGVIASLAHRSGRPDDAGAATREADRLLWAYVGRAVRRLGDGYGEDTGPLPDQADPRFLRRPEAAIRFAALATTGDQAAFQACAHCEAIMERFCEGVDRAASTPAAARLADAQIVTTIRLADEPDLAVTVHLDRSPIEIVTGTAANADAELVLPSVDLTHIWSAEFHVPIAIVRGRASVRGPVRRFLRVLPVLRAAARGHPAEVAG